ncbi:hypothetical protein BSLG_001033 [Batrachochytrium salamandrivorans]|nr:hypothetical protein BSLG_001033 [Batrachochytrium salamandrivorans]
MGSSIVPQLAALRKLVLAERNNVKCVKLRALFDNDKLLTNPKEIELALLNAERLISANAHPTPYIAPTGFNGTSWERNYPVPEELIRRGVMPVDNC